jgi:ribose transport system permease protein
MTSNDAKAPAEATLPTEPNPGVWRKLLSVPELGILIPLLAVTGIFAAINPVLLTTNNLTALLRALSFIGIIAVGQTFLMVSGELDLSVGSVAGLCAIVAAWLMKTAGWPVPVAIAATLLLGASIGLVNGLLAVRVGLPAFIVTLGMLYIARGANYLICAGYPIYPLPDSLKNFGAAEPLGISWSFLIFFCLVLLGDFLLRRTVFGRKIAATGGNREVAHIAGINTHAVKIACYMLTGALAAFGGILLMAQIAVGQPEVGQGWELDVIAGVVIGGVSLFGGVGTVAGTFLGLLLMQVIRTGLVLTNVNTHWQTVSVGAIMIAAVAFDLLRRRAKIA